VSQEFGDPLAFLLGDKGTADRDEHFAGMIEAGPGSAALGIGQPGTGE
jgi:hypothetical protein